MDKITEIKEIKGCVFMLAKESVSCNFLCLSNVAGEISKIN